MNKKILLILFFLFVSVTISFAKKAPTMPNSYDSFGLSARSFAMGHTGAAMANNLENVFYNPAGIAYNSSENIQAEAFASVIRNSDLDNNDLQSSHPIDLGFTSFAVVQKQGAISWRTLSSNEIEVTDGANFYKKQEHIKAITITAANLSNNGSAVGINLSYLYGTLSESAIDSGMPFAQTSSGNGFTMDIGFMAPIKKNLFFGVNLENVFGIMWWENYDFDQLPFGIRTGIGYVAGTFNLLCDWNKKFYRFGNIEDDTLIGVGIEQYLGNVLVLRAGAQGTSLSDTEKIKYTYGAGINIAMISLSVSGENYKINDEPVSQYCVSVKVLI